MRSIERILVPVDFSEPSRAALEQARQLAKALGARIEVLAVWEPPHWVAPDAMLAVPGYSAVTLEEHGVAATGEQLARFVADLPPGEVLSTVEVGRPAASILRRAEGADLIVMGTTGRGSASRAVLGSVSSKVAAAAPCPVLVVNIPKPR